MTAHPIDTEALREAREDLRKIAEGAPDYEGLYIAPSVALSILDALAAAEARATRAEAQSEARRINAAYWKERVKAVEDVLDRFAIDGHDQLVHGQVIRRALDGTVTPRDAG